MDLYTGIIKWFSRHKGYGLISPDDFEQEVLFCCSDLSEGHQRDFQRGQRVQFQFRASARGPEATNVNVVE